MADAVEDTSPVFVFITNVYRIDIETKSADDWMADLGFKNFIIELTNASINFAGKISIAYLCIDAISEMGFFVTKQELDIVKLVMCKYTDIVKCHIVIDGTGWHN
jgi:hypothetical protein